MAKLKEKFFKLLPPTIFFFVALHIVAGNKKLLAASQPFNRFSDLSEVQDFHITFKYVFHVALHRRLAYAGCEPVKSVFFVTRSEAAQLVKIHAIMTDHSPLKVEMFEDRAAAARSLGVPIESLIMAEAC